MFTWQQLSVVFVNTAGGRRAANKGNNGNYSPRRDPRTVIDEGNLPNKWAGNDWTPPGIGNHFMWGLLAYLQTALSVCLSCLKMYRLVVLGISYLMIARRTGEVQLADGMQEMIRSLRCFLVDSRKTHIPCFKIYCFHPCCFVVLLNDDKSLFYSFHFHYTVYFHSVDYGLSKSRAE